MEHPAPSLDALVRTWRARTVIASAVAAVELVLILVAGAALLGKPLARQAREAGAERSVAPRKPARRPSPSLRIAPPQLTRAHTSVLVLNGNGRTGAAAAAAERVRMRGYRIGAVGNALRSDYTRSMIMYRPRFRPEALRLSRDLGVGLVGPLDGLRPADLQGSQLALIVGE